MIEAKPIIEQTDYYQYGFKSALQSKGNPKVIPDFLEGIYAQMASRGSIDSTDINTVILNTQNALAATRQQQTELQAQVQSTQYLINQTQNDLKALEIDKTDYEHQNISGNQQGLNFTLAVLVLICLSFFLFLFYASAGYTALFGLAEGSNGFLNVNLFETAHENGIEVLGFVILFPTLFFAVGFALHIALDNQKKNMNTGRINPVIPIISITLIADLILGYKIAQGLHYNAFNHGHTDDLWHFSMIFTDLTFYLVLIIGFATYILWGFLLHYILAHPNLKSETVDILYTNTKIQTKREALNNLNQTLNVLKDQFEQAGQDIKIKTRQLQQLELGQNPLNYSTIKLASEAFINGFKAQIRYCVTAVDTQIDYCQKADRLHADWLAEKHLLTINTPLS